MSIKLGDFDLFRDLLYKESGLVVTPDKTYLLESRLLPVAKKWNFAYHYSKTTSGVMYGKVCYVESL